MTDKDETEYASREALNAVKDGLDELRKDISELRGWLVGRVDENGHPVPGVLQTIDGLRSAKKWILTLLSAIATSSIINAVVSFLHNFH